MSIQKNIRTATACIPPANYGSNSRRNDGMLRQYFRDSSKEFYRQKIPMTCALFDGEIQGVNANDFYAWTPVRIRSSDVIDPTTGDHLNDDWQSIIIENTNIDSIHLGAYVKFNDSVWIVINPDDVGSVTGNTIVKRCNCTYNTLDYFGNVVQTPMSYAKGMALASQNDVTEYINLPSTYQHVALQLNEATANVHNNTRLILGGQAYYFTGVTNFIREYTMDPTSAHLIRAECRLGEANVYDDLVNEVANDSAFTWEIDISGSTVMPVGATQTLTATSLRNGVTPDAENNPFSYIWESSDPDIISVDDSGNLTALEDGISVITCYLSENMDICSTIDITASQSLTGAYVEFINDLPLNLRAYDSVSCEAAYFLNGIKQTDTVDYSFNWADANRYGIEIDGNVLTITCYGTSQNPLIVTATCNGESTTQTLYLIGY